MKTLIFLALCVTVSLARTTMHPSMEKSTMPSMNVTEMTTRMMHGKPHGDSGSKTGGKSMVKREIGSTVAPIGESSTILSESSSTLMSAGRPKRELAPTLGPIRESSTIPAATSESSTPMMAGRPKRELASTVAPITESSTLSPLPEASTQMLIGRPKRELSSTIMPVAGKGLPTEMSIERTTIAETQVREVTMEPSTVGSGILVPFGTQMTSESPIGQPSTLPNRPKREANVGVQASTPISALVGQGAALAQPGVVGAQPSATLTASKGAGAQQPQAGLPGQPVAGIMNQPGQTAAGSQPGAQPTVPPQTLPAMSRQVRDLGKASVGAEAMSTISPLGQLDMGKSTMASLVQPSVSESQRSISTMSAIPNEQSTPKAPIKQKREIMATTLASVGGLEQSSSISPSGPASIALQKQSGLGEATISPLSEPFKQSTIPSRIPRDVDKLPAMSSSIGQGKDVGMMESSTVAFGASVVMSTEPSRLKREAAEASTPISSVPGIKIGEAVTIPSAVNVDDPEKLKECADMFQRKAALAREKGVLSSSATLKPWSEQEKEKKMMLINLCLAILEKKTGQEVGGGAPVAQPLRVKRDMVPDSVATADDLFKCRTLFQVWAAKKGAVIEGGVPAADVERDPDAVRKCKAVLNFLKNKKEEWSMSAGI